jgi:carbonic anhydrase
MGNADEMLDAAAQRPDELAAPGLSPRPQRKVAVISCMDTRIDLFPMLGLQRGDAHIIRNAGGLATDDAIRSLSPQSWTVGTIQKRLGPEGDPWEGIARTARPLRAASRPRG